MAEFLSREAILAADDTQVEVVQIPQWGGAVRVRGLTGRERAQFESVVTIKPTGSARKRRQTSAEVRDDLRERLVAWCVIDQAGKRLFTNADVEQLRNKSAAALEPIVDAAMRLSGMADDDLDDLAQEMADDPFGA